MFGLRNQRGSCWINAAVQAVFRIPEVKTRFIAEAADDKNPVETSLQEIWTSKGEDGLQSFYDCVKTSTMPAGEGIGDSHELIEFLCDKIPFLDKLLRFKVANTTECNSCDYKDTRPDSLIEFSISPAAAKQSVSDSIGQAVAPSVIPEWTCEKCSKKGCTRRLLLGSFPQVLMFHTTSSKSSVSYSSILVVNKIRYALFGVVCFNGGHWWSYGRDLPPGNPWIEFDDTHVRTFDPQHFPLSDSMRLLMYYRLNE